MAQANKQTVLVMIPLLIFVVVLGLALGLYRVAGSRASADLAVRFEPAAMGEDLDRYLASREAVVPGLMPGMGKEIVWADPVLKRRTPVSVVYIHGYSATKEEIRPVPDLVAARLGANLHYTRLAGHGFADPDGLEMATASVEAWMDDMAEALAIGRRLGERVLVVSTSTGCTLAALAAANPKLAGSIDAVVMVSPNFRIKKDPLGLLGGPLARLLVPVLAGRESGFEPINDEHAAYWTERYPSAALLPLGAIVRRTKAIRYERLRTPLLVFSNPGDTVVDARATAAVARRWGGPSRLVEVTDAENDHVLAGDVLSPSTTARVVDEVVEWANLALSLDGASRRRLSARP